MIDKTNNFGNFEEDKNVNIDDDFGDFDEQKS